jgi:hypothetical protein
MLKRLCLSLLIATLPAIALAERDLDDLRTDTSKDEWRLAKNDNLHKIKVYVKKEEGQNIRSFRVVSTVDASIDTLARIQTDFDNYLRWYFAALEVKFLKKVSDKEYFYYIVHDAPIGTPDRDAILRTVIEPMTAKRPYVFMRISAVPDFLPPRPPYVRMLAENYTVKWTPIDKNTTLVESEGFINPGGNAPAWAINFAQNKGPYVNLMGMARQAKLAKYTDDATPLPYTFFE